LLVTPRWAGRPDPGRVGGRRCERGAETEFDADKEYAITDLDTNTITRKQGRELMEQGFPLEIAKKPGAALLAYKVEK